MAETDDDIHGKIGDLVRLGAIASVDLAAARVTVACGEVSSPPCPWLEMAGGFRSWIPPVVGEQVLLLCPEADIAGAVVLRGLYSTAHPAPRSDTVLRFSTPDGATFDYDPDAHALTIALPAGGSIDLDGDLNVTGTITATEDVVGGGKSLKTHKHGGVQAGGAQTGVPA